MMEAKRFQMWLTGEEVSDSADAQVGAAPGRS